MMLLHHLQLLYIVMQMLLQPCRPLGVCTTSRRAIPEIAKVVRRGLQVRRRTYQMSMRNLLRPLFLELIQSHSNDVSLGAVDLPRHVRLVIQIFIEDTPLTTLKINL